MNGGAALISQVRLAQQKRHEAEQMLHTVIAQANTAQMLHTKIDAQINLAELWLRQNKTAAAQPLLAELQRTPQLTPVQQRRIEELVTYK